MHSDYWEEQALMYVTNDLAGSARRAFEDHLKTCKTCQDDVGEWHTIAGASEEHFRHTPILQRRQWAKVLPFAAAVMLVVALGMILASGGQYGKSPNTGAAPNLQATDVPTEVLTIAPTEIGPTTTTTPTPIPTDGPTSVPTVTITPSPIGDISPTVAFLPTATPFGMPSSDSGFGPAATFYPPSHFLSTSRIEFENQTWNNQGAATLSMGLSYYDVDVSQEDIASIVHANPDDPNVSPRELADYVNASVDGIAAIERAGGDLDLLKRLISAGYPVMVEAGVDFADNDWYGHYHLLFGYDASTIYYYDSFLGQGDFSMGITRPNDLFLEEWWQFSNSFIVLFPVDERDEVVSILGDLEFREKAYQRMIYNALERNFDDPDDLWTLFNLGDAFASLGQYEIASAYFGLITPSDYVQEMPFRLLWYRQSPLEAFYQTENYQAGDLMLGQVLGTTSNVEELYYYQGLFALLVEGSSVDPIEAFQASLRANPNYQPAKNALMELGVEVE